jgi:hypothetical protein
MVNTFTVDKADRLLSAVMPWLIRYLFAAATIAGLMHTLSHAARMSLKSWLFGVPFAVMLSAASAALLGAITAALSLDGMHRPIYAYL